ncbi:hypothetical protein C8A01DRAFT_39342 [Parachaetomium inaequale]|uniref:Uncharacterized protein n=1 Tax=Parachaetomium inaequale TaxID=2588326 RepID=A0AAN6P9D0_9PEZI|nr:hypothetical protein C8A01DRAFT_39342 [Parachaetomium inaequale]
MQDSLGIAGFVVTALGFLFAVESCWWQRRQLANTERKLSEAEAARNTAEAEAGKLRVEMEEEKVVGKLRGEVEKEKKEVGELQDKAADTERQRVAAVAEGDRLREEVKRLAEVLKSIAIAATAGHPV